MAKTTAELKDAFIDGAYEELLKDIYVDKNMLEYQKERYIKALEAFEALYGEKEVEIYSAPGRSEVGGNHTDHQYGKVLAASINLDAIAVVAKTEDEQIRIKSEGYEPFEVNLNDLNLSEEEKGTSKALTKGVASKLKEKDMRLEDFRLI